MKNTNLILGKIGVGKTTGVMFKEIDKIIDNNENLIIVDNKAEYYKTYAEKLVKNLYRIYVINFKDSTKSNGFNPLLLPYKLYKEGNIDTAIKIVHNFSKNLMTNQKSMDSFWQDSAASYLTGLILILFKEGKEEEINLASIQVMISKIENNVDKFREYVSNLDLISPEYTYLSGTLFSPNETRGGIISVLKMELTKYISTDNLLNMLCTNEIDLSNKDEKTAIFIIGNNDYKKLTSVVISEAINSDICYNYILDNFDSLDKMTLFDDLLDNAVVDNNKVYVVSRNIENITSIYGKLITDKFEVIENVNEGGILEKVGNFDNYPKVNKNQIKYFDLNNIL